MIARRTLLLLARLGVAGAILGVILLRTHPGKLNVQWSPTTSVAFAGAVAVQLAALAISTVRWKLILEDGPVHATWSYLFRLYLIGNFFSIFLPTSIGGDAVRVVAVAPTAGGTVRAAVSILLDRLAGVAALGGYLILGLAVGGSALAPLGAVRARWPVWEVAAGILAVTIGGWVGLRWLRRRFTRLREAWATGWELVTSLVQDRRRLSAVVATSLLVQGAYIVAWMILGAGLGLPIRGVLYLVCVPIVSLGAMLPVTFSGLGVREGVWLLLLASLSAPKALILAFSLLYFAALVVVAAIGGLVFLIRGTAEATGATGSAPA